MSVCFSLNFKCSIFVTQLLKKLSALKNILFALLILPAFSNAQFENEFNNEFYGGLVFHSAGWGGSMTYSKYLTENKRSIIELDLVSIRHPKQVKTSGLLADNKKFVYGKLNSAYNLRLGYGRKKVIANNSDQKSVEISLVYTGGFSIAALKPVYLNVASNVSITPVLEKYNPDNHSITNIYGGAPNFTGLNEMRYIIGGYAKFGVIANYSPYQNYVRAIEAGISLDYFIEPLPLMAFNEHKNIYPNVYLKFMFGRIYR